MNRIFLLLYVFIVNVSLSYSQSHYKIYGTTVSSKNNNSVPFVSVIAKDSIGDVIAFCYSDSVGKYEIILNHKMDSVLLEISSVGYLLRKEKVLITEVSTKKNIFLLPAPAELPTVNVVAPIPKIRQSGDTIDFNANAYKTIKQKNIGDLLKDIPGFKVDDNGKMSYNGKAIDNVLLEGTDLFGNDYGKLIKNVSTNGIDELQVIKHYKDKTDLSKSFSVGDEQVLNIKYKGNKFLKEFGTIAAGLNFENKYEDKVDLITLTPKTKIVAIGNANSIGNLGTELSGENDNNVVSSQISNLDYLSSSPYVSASEISDQNINKNRYSFNHSSFADITAQHTISKSLNIKADLQLINDKYFQFTNSRENYFNTNPLLQIAQTDTLHNKNNIANFSSTINYTRGTKFQSIYFVYFNNAHTNQHIAEDLNQQFNQQNINNQQSKYEHDWKTTYLLNDKNLFTLEAKMGSYSIPEKFILSPFYFDTIFNYAGNYKDMLQNIYDKNRTWQLNLNYVKKISTTRTITILTGWTKKINGFMSNLFALNSLTPDSTQSLNNKFINNIKYSSSKYYATISYSDRINKAWNYSISGGINSYKLDDEQKNSGIDLYKKKSDPDFEINSSYQINKYSSFNLSYSLSSIYSSTNNILTGYILTGYHSLNAGSNILDIRNNSQSASFIYDYIDLQKRKLLVFGGLFLNAPPVMYVNNLAYSNIYTMSTSTLSNKTNNSIAFFYRVEKVIPATLSRIIFLYNGNIANTYMSSSNFILQKTRYTGNNFSLQYVQDIGKWFRLNMQASDKYSVQKNGSFGESSIRDLMWNATTDFRLADKLSFSVEMNQISHHSNIGNAQNVFLMDVYFDYQIISNKLQLSAFVRNLLNKKEIGNVSAYINYNDISSYTIQRTSLFSLTYKF